MYPSTTKITPTQRRHIALAELPVVFRDEALASSQNCSSTLILNNGEQLSTPPQDKPSWGAVHHLPRFPVTLSPDELKARPSAKRDWVGGMCRDIGISPEKDLCSLSPENIAKWRNAFRWGIGTVDGIEDNNFNTFRRFNFESCGAKKSWGQEIVYEDGATRHTVFTCGETACPICYDKSKRRTAMAYHNKFMAVAQAQCIGRFWAFVITLPQEIEAIIPKGAELRRRFLFEIKKLLRKLFSLKTEDGLCAYANVHPVGDSDLFRDRFHVHIGVLPIAIRRKKKQASLIKCDIEGLFDTEAVLRQLEEILCRIFPITPRGKAQFHAQYIPFNEKYSAARLAHRLTYDLRGFGKDVERAPIFFDPVRNMAVLEAGENGYSVYSVKQIARRWAWIRSQRDLRTWGLLNQWNKYVDLLGVAFEDDPEPKIKEQHPIIVKRRYGREWNPKTRQVRWVDEKRAFRESSKEEIKDVQWGRKGSDGFWRPRKDALPIGVHET